MNDTRKTYRMTEVSMTDLEDGDLFCMVESTGEIVQCDKQFIFKADGKAEMCGYGVHMISIKD